MRFVLRRMQIRTYRELPRMLINPNSICLVYADKQLRSKVIIKSFSLRPQLPTPDTCNSCLQNNFMTKKVKIDIFIKRRENNSSLGGGELNNFSIWFLGKGIRCVYRSAGKGGQGGAAAPPMFSRTIFLILLIPA